MDIEAIVILVFIGIAGVVAYRWWFNRWALHQAAEVSGQMYALWAAMGPYENGETSAYILRYAYTVARRPGSATAAELFDSVGHAEAYDADPQQWEELRQNSLTGPKRACFNDQLAAVKGMVELDEYNAGIFRDAGFRGAFEANANGDLSVVYRDLETGQIETRFQGNEDAIAYATVSDIGNKILNDKSFEASLLLEALKPLYDKIYDKDMESTYDLGIAYAHMLEYIENNPGSGAAQMFTDANDLWLKSKGKANQ